MNKNAKGRPILPEDERQAGIHFRVPGRSLNRLDALGVAAGMTRSQILRLAIDAVVEVGERRESDDRQRTG